MVRNVEDSRFRASQSGEWLSVDGQVSRLHSDDNEGSRHQRFILTVSSNHTLLIAHNIDLAPRVPVALGDRVHVRGMYEWNDLGGLIHWTHHDPMGVEAGGYITHRRRDYR